MDSSGVIVKPTYRLYIADRAAKFTYPDRVLVLRKHDQFQLTEFEAHHVVVKDGIRWPIAKSMVKELIARSVVSKASPKYVSSVKEFDKLGYKFLKYLVAQSKKLTTDEVRSGFKNNEVYVYWTHRLPTVEIRCSVVVRPDSLHAMIYSPTVLKLSEIDVYEPLTRLVKRMARHMTDDGIEVRGFRSMVSHTSNVGTPWKEKFSGTIYSFATKISL